MLILNKLHAKRFRIALLLVIGVALTLRVIGIDWDDGHALHPDERMIMMVTNDISFENLNPEFFNYGNLPIYIFKLFSSIAGTVDISYAQYPGMLLVGRTLSAMFDTGTVLLIFLLGKVLWDKRAGLAGALLYALAVFPIQNAHFYIVDPQMTFWITLTLYIAVRNITELRTKHLIYMGITCGLAVATKFTGILSLGIPALVILYTSYQQLRWRQSIPAIIGKAIVSGVIVLVFAALFFGITQPYVVLDFETYWEQVSSQLRLNSDPTVFPYTIQFLNTTPYVHPIKGILLWGLGVPIGLISVIGLGLTTFKLCKDKRTQPLLVLLFAVIFFAVLGRSAVKYMRYYLPLYPILTLTGGYFIYYADTHFGVHKVLRRLFHLFIWPLVLIWPIAFLSIYTTENTRITATNWINTNLPTGSTILTEHWDDVVPLSNENSFRIEQLGVYEAETPQKWSTIDAQLENADYLVISSKRVYKSIMNWPEKYPQTINFYRELFAGNSDYVLIKTFTSYPRIGTLLEVPDDNAPESLTIFDHPKVWVWEKRQDQKLKVQSSK